MVKYIDSRGAVWEYRYNSYCELEWSTDPLGSQSLFTHDEWGNMLTALQPDDGER